MLSYAKPNESIVLIADARVLAIPIQDDHEPLIDLTIQKYIAYGPSPEIPNNHDYTKLRQSAYNKLVKAEASLPPGMHFCLYEGYRSLKLQQSLFEQHYAKVKKLHPDWSKEKIFIETTKLVSPVRNLDGSKNIPPHSTGGAIDVYLIDDNGNPLEMGIHPKDWQNDVDSSLSETASTRISAQAQENRRMMSKALNSVGFVNYPTEYWHWSYGDRYWAYARRETHAIYGTIS